MNVIQFSVINGISNHGVEVGMIGEVVSVGEFGADVKHPNFKWSWWSFNDYDLELVED